MASARTQVFAQPLRVGVLVEVPCREGEHRHGAVDQWCVDSTPIESQEQLRSDEARACCRQRAELRLNVRVTLWRTE